MPSKTLEIGQTIRREVLGADYVDHRAATAWPFAKPHQDRGIKLEVKQE